MPLIEGIGDEVVHFVAAVLLITVSTLAWWSTNARPDRYRSVFLMRSQGQRPISVSIHTGGEPSLFSARATFARATIHATPPNTAAAVPLTPVTPVGNRIVTVTPGAPVVNRTVIPLQEMDSIIDADVAMFNHSRMHFYRRVENESNDYSPSVDTSDSEGDDSPLITPVDPASTEQIREMDDIVNAMRGDVNAPSFTQPGGDINTNTTDVEDRIIRVEDESNDTTETDSGPVDPEEANRRKILIKLKYLNDTQKEVEGSLDELLKDFKWRHFSKELTEQSAVRLIYRGRVLEETRTLRACGLQHRAVVHALVHPHRQLTRQPSPHQVTGEAIAPLEIIHERVPAERTWDLENILMTLVSVALTVVWFFRCEYSNMFTASASVALFGLTVFYSVAIFGLYITDTFQVDRRQQPVPTN